MDAPLAVSAQTRITMDTVVTASSLHAMTPATLGSVWTARSCADYAEKIQTTFLQTFHSNISI